MPIPFDENLGVEGYLDWISPTSLRGWIYRRSAPSERISLELWERDLLVTVAKADERREDLIENSKSDGHCAFTIPTPRELVDGEPHEIMIRLAGTASSLLSQPVILRFPKPSVEAPGIAPAAGPLPGEYERWMAEYDSFASKDRSNAASAIGSFKRAPIVSIVLTAGRAAMHSEADWRRSANSVLGQVYPYWELLMPPRVKARLGMADPRLRPVSANTLDSVISQARGDLLGFVEAGDELAPLALFAMVKEWQTEEMPDIAYCDEDQVDTDGRRQLPYFKSGWNPDLFLAQDYVCRLAIVPTKLAQSLARGAPEPAAVYDLILRMLANRPDPAVRHVPLVLYHRKLGRHPDEATCEAMRIAVEDFVRFQAGCSGTAPPEVVTLEGAHRRILWPVPLQLPKVSIVIPTRDRLQLLQVCIDGILNDTEYRNLEIIVVDNDSHEAETKQYLARIVEDKRVRVVPYPGEFNYSAINNFAVTFATGEVIGLLNNDLKIFEASWLREMVSQAIRPDVGAVGAMLLYGDGTVQHAGVVLGIGRENDGVASHIFKRQPRASTGYCWRMALTQELSAVTAACMLTRADVWKQLGGLDDAFRVAFNDVDYCLRVRKAGYRVIWTPHARLYHLESASRGAEDSHVKRVRFASEKTKMHQRWGDLLRNDPFFSPNLSLTSVDCRLAFPPRTDEFVRSG